MPVPKRSSCSTSRVLFAFFLIFPFFFSFLTVRPVPPFSFHLKETLSAEIGGPDTCRSCAGDCVGEVVSPPGPSIPRGWGKISSSAMLAACFLRLLMLTPGQIYWSAQDYLFFSFSVSSQFSISFKFFNFFFLPRTDPSLSAWAPSTLPEIVSSAAYFLFPS